MNTIEEETKLMKYLKIENNKGHYLNSSNDWNEIDQISKDDLMFLLNKAVSEEFEMDEYLEEDIGHKAHQIVYKSIHEKFSELVQNKSTFKDECDSMFKAAVEKYEASEQNEE